jgi:hypothetical protein
MRNANTPAAHADRLFRLGKLAFVTGANRASAWRSRSPSHREVRGRLGGELRHAGRCQHPGRALGPAAGHRQRRGLPRHASRPYAHKARCSP